MFEGAQESVSAALEPAAAAGLGQRPFVLAEWSIEPTAGTATCESRTVRLEPKVMAVLVFLVDRAGEVVPKDQILDEVWRGTYVKEVVLARGISELRRLLGDDARSPRLIETLPKRGYRLIAEVVPVEPVPIEPEPQPESSRALAADLPRQRWWPAGWRPTGWQTAAIVTGVVALIVAFGTTLDMLWAKPHPDSIAVLPFSNFSGDPESDYFSDGMTEDIITALSKVRELKVVSRTSSMTYRNSTKSLPEIGRELRVASIVEGSVRREKDTVRITAQLIDVATDHHLWSHDYDRNLEDIFEIQRDVADRIVRALCAELSPQERRALERQPTQEVTAHDQYLRGREAYLRYERDANESAIKLYTAALAVDPDFALAGAGLASAYALRVANYGFGPESADLALAAAQQALALEPELPEAHKALGLAYAAQGRSLQARSSYRRALELRPDYDEAIHNIALLLFQLGEWDEAGRWQRRADALRQQLK